MGRNNSGRIGVLGMEEKRFSHPIEITSRRGNGSVCSDVHEALDCLMYGWRPSQSTTQELP